MIESCTSTYTIGWLTCANTYPLLVGKRQRRQQTVTTSTNVSHHFTVAGVLPFSGHTSGRHTSSSRENHQTQWRLLSGRMTHTFPYHRCFREWYICPHLPTEWPKCNWIYLPYMEYLGTGCSTSTALSRQSTSQEFRIHCAGTAWWQRWPLAAKRAKHSRVLQADASGTAYIHWWYILEFLYNK